MQSPFHVEESQPTPLIRALLNSPTQTRLCSSRELKVTPAPTQALPAAGNSSTRSSEAAYAHAADIVLGAYFFAMRSCEITQNTTPGRALNGFIMRLIFRTRSRRVLLAISDPQTYSPPHVLRHYRFLS
jgi:hypothetical protein